MATFFTADPHFGHAKILEYTKRPYRSIEEMDQALIANWNLNVSNTDLVYLLGDLTLSSDRNYIDNILSSLAGQIILVKGNHDKPYVTRHSRFAAVTDFHETRIEGYDLTLCHYPMLVWRNSHYGSLMLHGHSHGTGEDTNQRLDMGVDCWDYQPVKLENILARAEACKPHSKHDHHMRIRNDFEVS